jgi:hypothetical protein
MSEHPPQLDRIEKLLFDCREELCSIQKRMDPILIALLLLAASVMALAMVIWATQ